MQFPGVHSRFFVLMVTTRFNAPSLKDEVIVLSSSDSEGDVQTGKYDFYEDSLWIGEFLIGRRERAILASATAWFTDEIINAFLRILSWTHPNHYYFNTFFYSTLLRRGMEGVCRWARGVDLNQRDIVFIPINQSNSHWSLVVVHPKSRSLAYYDSLGGGYRSSAGKCIMERIAPFFFDPQTSCARPPRVVKQPASKVCGIGSTLHIGPLASLKGKTIGLVGLGAFIKTHIPAELERRQRTSLPTPPQYYCLFPQSIPRQSDGYSCGPFVCWYSQVLSALDHSKVDAHFPPNLNFNPASVQDLRQRMFSIFTEKPPCQVGIRYIVASFVFLFLLLVDKKAKSVAMRRGHHHFVDVLKGCSFCNFRVTVLDPGQFVQNLQRHVCNVCRRTCYLNARCPLQ